jgi:hypothetical protein
MRCGQAPSIPAISAAMAPLRGAAGTAISLAVRLFRVDAFFPNGLKSDRKGVLCPETDLQHFSIRSQQLQLAMHAISACQRQQLGVPNGKVATIFTGHIVTSVRYCADAMQEPRTRMIIPSVPVGAISHPADKPGWKVSCATSSIEAHVMGGSWNGR